MSTGDGMFEEPTFLAEPKVSEGVDRVRNTFVMPNHQMRRSLGDFSKDLAFEQGFQASDSRPAKKPNSTVGLSFSFVSLDAPSGTFSLLSGSSSSDDLRIKTVPNANSFQNFQELLHQGGLPSPSLSRHPFMKNLNYGAFGTENNAVNHFYNTSFPTPTPVCGEQSAFMDEPKWKEDTAMDEADIPERLAGEPNYAASPHHAFFGIFDAHGGRDCADYVHEHLHRNVTTHPSFKMDPERALLEGILKTEHDFIDFIIRDKREGTMGTTICAALICGNQLLVANVGDSTAILCRNGQHIRLAYPHTLQNVAEKERVEKAGAVIKNGKLCHPVWNADVFNLPLTRSIGDVHFKHDSFLNNKHSGLIAQPEIAKVALTPDDHFVFLGSSGYFDVVTPRETVDLIKQLGTVSPSDSCKELTNLALKRSGTNITTLLINLRK